MTERAPISAALRQLRRGVSLSALALGLACVIQLLVFAFVHFTDLRWETLKSGETNKPLVVKAAGQATPKVLVPLPGAQPSPSVGPPAPEGRTPAEVNRVETAFGVVLGHLSSTATVIGVFSGFSLAALTLIGAAVAGGGAVPGVEKAVSAAIWGLFVGMITLPWSDVFSSMPYAGVFVGYESMVAASDGRTMAGLSLIFVFIGLPVVAAVGTALVALRFNAGVERGIVADRPADAVDQEMAAAVRSLSSTRQLGAVRNDFRRAVAPTSEPEPASPAPPTPAAAPKKAPDKRAAEPPKRRREGLTPAEEADWKRPI